MVGLRHMLAVPGLAVLGLATGCGAASKATVRQPVTPVVRAAADLGCPVGAVKLAQMESGLAARGCGGTAWYDTTPAGDLKLSFAVLRLDPETRARAANELRCPDDEIKGHVHKTSERWSAHVEGCGRKTIYLDDSGEILSTQDVLAGWDSI